MYSWTLKYRNSVRTNLANPFVFTKGLRVVGNTGVSSFSNSHVTSEFVRISDAVNYAVIDGGNLRCVDISVYDNNKDFITGNSDNNGFGSLSQGGIDRAAFIRVSFFIESPNYDLSLISIHESILTPYAPYFLDKEVKPIYTKLDRGYQQNTGNEFYREKLSGGVKLLKEDYDIINNTEFDDIMYLILKDSQGYFNDYVGYFYKTDCKFDDDNKIVEVKTKPNDAYEKLLGGLQKEYNLLEIGATTTEVVYAVRPITQIYVLGEPIITNVWDGSIGYKEINIDPVFDENQLINNYKFSTGTTFYYVSKTVNTSLNLTGVYQDNSGGLGETKAIRIESGDQEDTVVYRIGLESRSNNNGTPANTGDNFTESRYYIFYESGGASIKVYATAWLRQSNPGFGGSNPIVPLVNPFHHPYTGINGNTGTFSFSTKKVFERSLYNIQGSNVSSITDFSFITRRPSDDIYEENNNYQWVSTTGGGVFHRASLLTRPFYEKYGFVPDSVPQAGEFYVKPTEYIVYDGLNGNDRFDVTELGFLPVNKVFWGELSIWICPTVNFTNPNPNIHPGAATSTRNEITLRDGYALHEVISRLLVSMGANVVFSNTTDYSEFLYAAANPLGSFDYSEPAFGGAFNYGTLDNFDLFITPKSNIVVSNYEQPAQKAEISLDRVLRMLKTTMQLYWHVEDNKLRIEHISWYNNGGSYTQQNVGLDLTTLIQPRNAKSWNFEQNKFEFEKDQMPERYEFGWMDDVSKSFEGNNIDIISGFVKEGNIEDVNVTGFTTDIDFILANPIDVSKDGFCLLSTFVDGGKNKVIFRVQQTGINERAFLQNGFLSVPFLQENYYVYNLPSNKVVINGSVRDIASTNVTKYKKQSVTYPSKGVINPYALVKTAIGNGKIAKLDVSMESLIIKAEIKHDTE